MADQPRECVLQLEDYMECLHHKKEKARAQAIKNEELKQRKQRKEAAEVARKITESNAKSDVMRIGILSNNDNNDQKTTTQNTNAH